jgi:hypothetical protein
LRNRRRTAIAANAEPINASVAGSGTCVVRPSSDQIQRAPSGDTSAASREVCPHGDHPSDITLMRLPLERTKS